MQNLLLLHGALGHAQQFNVIIPLLEKDFRVFTFNFSGHAGEAMPDKLSIQDFAGETANFISSKIDGKTCIFGHSMGGYVGLYLAKNKPELVENVMTLGTKLNWMPESGANEARMLNTEKMKEKVPAFAAQLEKLHGRDWETLCRKTAEMLVDMGNTPPLGDDDFKEIHLPVQLTVGDRDRMVSLEETIKAYRLLTQCRLLVLPSTPHPYEQADVQRLAYEIKGFSGVQVSAAQS